jgi:hypothetical protein
MIAQLRDMLTAEDSSIMAEKNDHRRPTGPERAKSLGLSVDIG